MHENEHRVIGNDIGWGDCRCCHRHCCRHSEAVATNSRHGSTNKCIHIYSIYGYGPSFNLTVSPNCTNPVKFFVSRFVSWVHPPRESHNVKYMHTPSIHTNSNTLLVGVAFRAAYKIEKTRQSPCHGRPYYRICIKKFT